MEGGEGKKRGVRGGHGGVGNTGRLGVPPPPRPEGEPGQEEGRLEPRGCGEGDRGSARALPPHPILSRAKPQGLKHAHIPTDKTNLYTER